MAANHLPCGGSGFKFSLLLRASLCCERLARGAGAADNVGRPSEIKSSSK